MPNLKKCVQELLKTHRITPSQGQKIIELLERKRNKLAIENLNIDEKAFLEEFIQQSAEAKRVAELQVIAIKRAGTQAQQHPRGMGAGIESLLARDTREQAGYSNVDFRAKAIYDKARSRAADAYENLGVRRLGLVSDDELAERVGRAMFGEKVDDAAAKLGKELSTAMDELRIRGNVGGKNIARRKDFGLPQTHDVSRIAATPVNEWVDFTAPLIRRIWTDDGAIEATAGIRKYLEAVHEQAVESAKVVQSGSRAGVALETESRRLIFDGYDAWKKYSDQFGHGNKGLLNIVDDHLRGQARDAALIEILGPRPRQTLDTLVNQAAKTGELTAWQRGRIDRLWNVVSGGSNEVDSQRLANTSAFIRSWLVASQLGSAVISAIGDVVTDGLTRHLNGLPVTRTLTGMFKGLSRADAGKLGAAADASLLAMQNSKFGEMAGTAGKAGKAADVVLRASGLHAWTEVRRRAFGVELLGNLGGLVHSQRKFANLDATIQRQLSKYGVTEELWNNLVLKTKTIGRSGAHFLDLDGFSALIKDLHPERPFAEAAEQIEAADRLVTAQRPTAALGQRINAQGVEAERIMERIQTVRDVENRLREMVATETEFATMTGGDARIRAITTWGAAQGSMVGEAARLGTLYKSFPLSLLLFHVGRGLNMPTLGGKVGYLSAFAAASTIMGAVSIQARDLFKGREPAPMDTPQFWLDAFQQGGALTVFENLLEADSGFERMLLRAIGPVGGLAKDAFDLTAGNAIQAARGKDTNIGRETARTVERLTPGSNIWYTRLIVQRLIWNNLQRLLDANPEESFRKQEETAKKWGRGESWWKPGEMVPN